MSGAERTPAAGDQEALELADLDTSRPAGRVEAAVRRAVVAAKLSPVDEGAAEAAAMLARGMDLAAAVRRDPYAVAAVGKPLMEQLARLGLDPQARSGGPAPDDPWAQLQREIATELAQDGGAGAGNRPA